MTDARASAWLKRIDGNEGKSGTGIGKMDPSAAAPAEEETVIFGTRGTIRGTRASKRFRVCPRDSCARIFTSRSTRTVFVTLTGATRQKEIPVCVFRMQRDGDLPHYAHKHRSSSTMARR